MIIFYFFCWWALFYLTWGFLFDVWILFLTWCFWIWREVFLFDVRFLYLTWCFWIWCEVFLSNVMFLNLTWGFCIWHEVFVFDVRFLYLTWCFWIWREVFLFDVMFLKEWKFGSILLWYLFPVSSSNNNRSTALFDKVGLNVDLSVEGPIHIKIAHFTLLLLLCRPVADLGGCSWGQLPPSRWKLSFAPPLYREMRPSSLSDETPI